LKYFVYDVYFMEKLSENLRALETDGTTEKTPTTLGVFETETMSQCETTTEAFVTSEETIMITERSITALH